MIFRRKKYPDVLNPKAVGTYATEAFSGGGYFYDAVLEYRVWIKQDDKLTCYSFAKYEDALKFSKTHDKSERPIALVLQKEYIDEQEPGEYVHIKRERIAEWQVGWLGNENRDTHSKIPPFLSEHKD